MKKMILLSILVNIVCLAQSQPWNLTGNGVTNPAINFLGTTNNQPLKFRVNNRYAGEIDSTSTKTFFGFGAGRSITTGFQNVAIGFKALSATTTAAFNTAIGSRALYSNISGNYNTALGADALYYNTTGDFNVATGRIALYNNSTGTSNTALGDASLYVNTTGSYNTAAGQQALHSNSAGNYNTAMGMYSMRYNSTGNYNTALGGQALMGNSTGTNNTASGYSALAYNSSGYLNTASGYQALYLNTTAGYNVANGAYALYSNTTGQANTADGYQSLWQNTTGSMNTAHGYYALASNTTSSYNTAVGTYALLSTTTSQNNTTVGYYAGGSYNLGWNNTMIGASCNANATGLYNCIAIGQAVTNTASSQARIGNSSTNSIGGYANWTNISDGRYKKDVNQNVKGIEFIMKLQPITYHLDISGLSKKLNESTGKEMDEFTQKAIAEKEKILFSGFVAQDVEKAAKETGYNFSGVDKPRNENSFYGLRYAEFVVPLVKAMQEQQQIINDLQKRIAELEKRSGSTDLSSDNSNRLHVWPNPSNDNVTINIIADSRSQAVIKIYDSKGALVKQQQAAIVQGSNQLAINMKGLAGGTYHLSAEWNSGQTKGSAQIIKQ